MKNEILPLVNPVSGRLPEHIVVIGSEYPIPALLWGSDYPVPEKLPAGLSVYWVEPWENQWAQKTAEKKSALYGRHENTVVIAYVVKKIRTNKSECVIVAKGNLQLGRCFVTVYGEPSCVSKLYDEEFRPLFVKRKDRNEFSEFRYRILESWHNGCDNAEDEVYAVCRNRDDAKEILLGLGHMMERKNSLGNDFPDPFDGKKVHVSWLDVEGVLTVWIGDKESNPMGSEHRRIFRITEED